MDIEDINNYELHLANFKLLIKLFKKHDAYLKLKELFFGQACKTPRELFFMIENVKNALCFNFRDSKTIMKLNEVDRKWYYLFNYVPYIINYWSEIKRKGVMTISELSELDHEWKTIIENKYKELYTCWQ